MHALVIHARMHLDHHENSQFSSWFQHQWNLPCDDENTPHGGED